MSLRPASRLALASLSLAAISAALVGRESVARACVPNHGDPSVLSVGDQFLVHVRLDQGGNGYVQEVTPTSVGKAIVSPITSPASGPTKALAEALRYENGKSTYELQALDAKGNVTPRTSTYRCPGKLARASGGWNRASLCDGVLERSFIDDNGIEHSLKAATSVPSDRLVGVGAGGGSHYSFFKTDSGAVARILKADGTESDLTLPEASEDLQGIASGFLVTAGTGESSRRYSVSSLGESDLSKPLFSVEATGGRVAVAATDGGAFIAYATTAGDVAFEFRGAEGDRTKSGTFTGPTPTDAVCNQTGCLVALGGGYQSAPMFVLVGKDGVAHSLAAPATASAGSDTLNTRCSAPLPGAEGTPVGSDQASRDPALGGSSVSSCSMGSSIPRETAGTATLGIGLCLLGLVLAHRRARR